MPRIASVYGKDPKRMPFDFPDVLAAIAPRALFVNAPVDDSNFDVTGVRECVDAVRGLFTGPETFEARYPNAGHDFPQPEREAAYRFLDRNLAG
jgi:hypothetical protein